MILALSRVTIPGDGVTTTFPVSFALGYLNEDDITARVGDEVDGLGEPVYRTITFITPELLQISGVAAGVGIPVVFERTVPEDVLLVDYEDGDILTDENLNIMQKQALMLTHQVLDGRFSAIDDDLDLGGHRITNMGDPIDNQDAATKAYVIASMIEAGVGVPTDGSVTGVKLGGNPNEHRGFLKTPTYVADRTALKALTPSLDKVAYVTHPLHGGWFDFVESDFTTLVAVDPMEALWVKATSVDVVDGVWVRRRTGLRVYPEWANAARDGVTNDQPSIQAAVNICVPFGWDLGLSSGKYRVESTTVISSAAHTVAIATSNLTVNIWGEGSGNTSIIHSGFNGPAFDVQGKIISFGISNKYHWQGFSITYGNLGAGQGVKIDNVAYATFTDFCIFGLHTAFIATDMLTSSFFGCAFSYGIYGLEFSHSDFSRPNAVSFYGCTIAGYNERAIRVQGGTAFNFYGGSIEGNGTNGVDPFRAAVLFTNPGVEGGMAAGFYGVHFEANVGLADILINHSGADPVMLIVDACNMQRGDLVNKTTHNILVQQNTAGTGRVDVIARSSFRHFNNYVPTTAERAIRFISDPACQYDCDDSGSSYGSNLYRFQETTPTPCAMVKFRGSDGVIVGGSKGVDGVTRNSVGNYTINLRNTMRGTSPIFVGTSTNIGFVTDFGATATSVSVRFFNLAGALEDPTAIHMVIYDSA